MEYKRSLSRRPRWSGVLAVLAALVFTGWAGSASAQTTPTVVGYWRMETDNDAGATSVSVPNQVAGGTPLVSATATLALPVPGFNGTKSATAAQIADPLTLSTVSNTRSLDGNADVAATAASYSALNTSSITVEGFFRTQEGTATLVARSSGTSGFVISQPNNVTVTYYINGVAQTLHGGSGGITGGVVDLDDPYTHLAFTYNSTTGVANLYANGVLRGTNTTAGGGASSPPPTPASSTSAAGPTPAPRTPAATTAGRCAPAPLSAASSTRSASPTPPSRPPSSSRRSRNRGARGRIGGRGVGDDATPSWVKARGNGMRGK